MIPVTNIDPFQLPNMNPVECKFFTLWHLFQTLAVDWALYGDWAGNPLANSQLFGGTKIECIVSYLGFKATDLTTLVSALFSPTGEVVTKFEADRIHVSRLSVTRMLS